jgi:hypothetical protein
MDSSYSSDLIRLWEEHSFMSLLESSLMLSKDAGRHATRRFDSIYSEIFFRNPELLSVLRGSKLGPYRADMLRLCGLTYRIFQPFLQFRGLLCFPFPEGDSPLDFLADPRRAGVLYANPADTAEEVLLIWIDRAKYVLSGRSDFRLDGWVKFTYKKIPISAFYSYLTKISLCRTSTRLLQGLQSLNLCRLWDELAAAGEISHWYLHLLLLDTSDFRRVVEWLWVSSDLRLRSATVTPACRDFRCPLYKPWNSGRSR